jgi:hypothetical protein
MNPIPYFFGEMLSCRQEDYQQPSPTYQQPAAAASTYAVLPRLPGPRGLLGPLGSGLPGSHVLLLMTVATNNTQKIVFLTRLGLY